MKRYGNLYPLICSDENIELAITNSAKGKKDYIEVREVLENKDKYFKLLKDMLINKTYVCSPYDMFIKNDKGKKREIFKLPFFPDRIIQHAIMQVLELIWKSTLISHTFQSIKGRGVHLCLKHIRKAVQIDGMKYCLQLDIRKFYPSINNELLKLVIRRKIKCKDTLEILDVIIDGRKGVPIGNYISQYLANIFLSALDHLIKEQLKHKYYYRYCDDLIILSNSKEELKNSFELIKEELYKIKLEIKDNYQIYEINNKRGVNSFGYLVHPNSVKLRKSLSLEFSRKVARMLEIGYVDIEVLSSYYGWFKYANADKLWHKNIQSISHLIRKQDVKIPKLVRSRHENY